MRVNTIFGWCSLGFCRRRPPKHVDIRILYFGVNLPKESGVYGMLLIPKPRARSLRLKRFFCGTGVSSPKSVWGLGKNEPLNLTFFTLSP